MNAGWTVVFADEFDAEFEALPAEVQDEFFAQAIWIERFGPEAGRPRVDSLKGSKFARMKELRFSAADGVWRFAFAFNPKQTAVVLVAGDKSGVSEKRFYERLVARADRRFAGHLRALEGANHASGRKTR